MSASAATWFTTIPTFAIVYACSPRRHADSQYDLWTIRHCGSFAEAASEETCISFEGIPCSRRGSETSDCPMEQVADENPSASQQPDNVNMEQVDYDRDMQRHVSRLLLCIHPWTGHTRNARTRDALFQGIDGSTTSHPDPHMMHSGPMAEDSSMIQRWNST